MSLDTTLKHELALNNSTLELLTPQQLMRQLAFWVDDYYNRERRHSTIDYLSPIEYEQQFINTRTLNHVEPWHLSTKPGQPHIIEWWGCPRAKNET